MDQGDPVMAVPSFCVFLGKPNQVLTENAGGNHLPGRGGKTELFLK